MDNNQFLCDTRTNLTVLCVMCRVCQRAYRHVRRCVGDAYFIPINKRNAFNFFLQVAVLLFIKAKTCRHVIFISVYNSAALPHSSPHRPQSPDPCALVAWRPTSCLRILSTTTLNSSLSHYMSMLCSYLLTSLSF